MARRRMPEEEPELGAEDAVEPEGAVGNIEYGDMAEDAPMKTMEDGTEEEDKSLSDAESSQETQTDIQAIVKKSFPQGLGGEGVAGKIVDAFQVARVYPESFMPLIRLGVRSDYRKTAKNKPFDLHLALLKWYTSTSIPLEGRSRIELAEFAGATKEAQKQNILGGMQGGY